MSRRRSPRPVALALATSLAVLAGACSDGGGEPDLTEARSGVPVELAPAPGFDGETIHVGLLVPSTGPLAEQAAERATGLQAYLDYITTELGGIGTKYPIVLDVRDSADPETVEAHYDELRAATVLLAQVQGRGVVDALLPSIEADGALAFPVPAELADAHDPSLVPIGTPDELLGANAVTHVLGGDLPDDAPLCLAVQDDADAGGWQAGVAATVARADRELAATVTIPAAPEEDTGVQPQVDALVAASCQAVFLSAGSNTTAELLTGASAAGLDATFVIPAASSTRTAADDGLAKYRAEHVLVIGDGPVDEEPVGLTELNRIRDGYAPGQALSGPFTAGYLQGKAVVSVLQAALGAGDLSPASVRAAATKLRKVTFDDLAADAGLGPAESRRVPTTSTVSRIDDTALTGLRAIAFGVDAQLPDDVVEELAARP